MFMLHLLRPSQKASAKECLYSMKICCDVSNRTHVRGLWGIGQPFFAKPTSAIEAKLSVGSEVVVCKEKLRGLMHLWFKPFQIQSLTVSFI